MQSHRSTSTNDSPVSGVLWGIEENLGQGHKEASREEQGLPPEDSQDQCDVWSPAVSWQGHCQHWVCGEVTRTSKLKSQHPRHIGLANSPKYLGSAGNQNKSFPDPRQPSTTTRKRKDTKYRLTLDQSLSPAQESLQWPWSFRQE